MLTNKHVQRNSKQQKSKKRQVFCIFSLAVDRGDIENMSDSGAEVAEVSPSTVEAAEASTSKRAREPQVKHEFPVQTNISHIGNREVRHKHYVKLRREKEKEKKKRREDRKKEAEALGDQAPPKLVPKTIESMREEDETTVAAADAPEEEQDEEVNLDISNDEFKDYFSKSYEPKVLITTGDNPHSVRKVLKNFTVTIKL